MTALLEVRNLRTSFRVDGAELRAVDDVSFSVESGRVGVNNLFDAKPPLSADSRGYEPSLYNVLARGRTYSVQITKKL